MVLRWDGFAPANLPEIQKRACRWLSADWQPDSAIAALCEDGALIAQGGGRLLRCSSFYEDFVKTVLTINTSWSSTCRMAAALVTEPGDGAFPVQQQFRLVLSCHIIRLSSWTDKLWPPWMQ